MIKYYNIPQNWSRESTTLFQIISNKHIRIFLLYLESVHKIRTHLGGGGGQRFVTNPCKNIGICTVLRYERERRS
jgi:hypothetical protein